MDALKTLEPRQIHWAKLTVARVKQLDGMLQTEYTKQVACDIVLATEKVESDFWMYANKYNKESLLLPHDKVGEDHGSVGLIQQQVGGAPHSTADWGTTEELMDVNVSVHKFVKVLVTKTLHGNHWLQLTHGEAAQMVQVSAVPDAYQKQNDFAVALRKQLW